MVYIYNRQCFVVYSKILHGFRRLMHSLVNAFINALNQLTDYLSKKLTVTYNIKIPRHNHAVSLSKLSTRFIF